MCNLRSFVQSKKREKHPWWSVTFSSTFAKSSTPLWGFFTFFFLEEFVLNCAKQMLLKNIHIHSSNLLIFNFLNCFLFWNSTRDCQVNDSTVNFISSGKLSGISQKPRCHLCICWKLCIPIIMKPIDSGHCLAVIEKSTFNNLNMYEFKCFLKRVGYVK